MRCTQASCSYLEMYDFTVRNHSEFLFYSPNCKPQPVLSWVQQQQREAGEAGFIGFSLKSVWRHSKEVVVEIQ